MEKKKTAWQIHCMQVYKEMKDKDPSINFGTALKEAKKSYVKK